MRKIAFAGLIIAIAVASSDVSAQVPPHYPGTICFTPHFWCWMPNPGPVGAPCACSTPRGWVGGQRG